MPAGSEFRTACGAARMLLCLGDKIRLVRGSHAREGRLEVYHDGQWGTVCDDGFDHNAAAVACYQLGYG